MRVECEYFFLILWLMMLIWWFEVSYCGSICFMSSGIYFRLFFWIRGKGMVWGRIWSISLSLVSFYFWEELYKVNIE